MLWQKYYCSFTFVLLNSQSAQSHLLCENTLCCSQIQTWCDAEEQSWQKDKDNTEKTLLKIEQRLKDIQTILIQAKVTNPEDIHSNILRHSLKYSLQTTKSRWMVQNMNVIRLKLCVMDLCGLLSSNESKSNKNTRLFLMMKMVQECAVLNK